MKLDDFGILSKLNNWVVYEIPRDYWYLIPEVHRRDDAIAIFASGCFERPQRLNGFLANIGIDTVAYEANPFPNTKEEEINVYHTVITRLPKVMPDGSAYWLDGPYCNQALQPHWPSAKNALDFYSKIGTLLE
ncbi:MAG: hypothetical protein WC390_06595 [Sulfurimonas sp.]